MALTYILCGHYLKIYCYNNSIFLDSVHTKYTLGCSKAPRNGFNVAFSGLRQGLLRILYYDVIVCILSLAPRWGELVV